MGAFDGGLISSDGGALLLGATDEAIGLVDRFAACFRDGRAPELIGHSIATLVRRRVVGIVLGYEDLIDHDELRHDPVMAVLALPLYIFCGRHLLAAKLRRANIDASAGASLAIPFLAHFADLTPPGHHRSFI